MFLGLQEHEMRGNPCIILWKGCVVMESGPSPESRSLNQAEYGV